MEDTIKALPDLLSRLREQNEGNAPGSKEISGQLDTINEMVQALDACVSANREEPH